MTRLRRFEAVDARLVQHRWRWAEENRNLIAEHWARRVSERPAMFNGRVLMVCGLDASERRLAARFFETDYAAMTVWLDLGCPDASVANGFAMGALQGVDGAFLLGRMAAHTANSGQLYFPAGTPDLGDVTAEGGVDLEGSLMREIGEETGLDPAECSVETPWTLVEAEGKTAFMRPVRLMQPAKTACARIRTFLKAQDRPELADVEVVSSPADPTIQEMPAYMRSYLSDAFARQRS